MNKERAIKLIAEMYRHNNGQCDVCRVSKKTLEAAKELLAEHHLPNKNIYQILPMSEYGCTICFCDNDTKEVFVLEMTTTPTSTLSYLTFEGIETENGIEFSGEAEFLPTEYFSGKKYISYEPEPAELYEKEMTIPELRKIYKEVVDKKDFPMFHVWFDNMRKLGIFEEVKYWIVIKRCFTAYKSGRYVFPENGNNVFFYKL